MTRKEQLRFVRKLSDNIVRDIQAHIRDGVVPDNWDGHELRTLLADRHEASAAIGLIRRHPRSARARAYRNDVLTLNL